MVFYIIDPHWCPCGASGNASDIYNFLMNSNNGSIDTDSSYPLSGKCDTVCHFTKAGKGVDFHGYAYNNIISEDLLQEVLQYGPITAEVDASPASFKNYTGGIYDDPACTGTQVSHALLVVGYGTQNDQDFWIARNRFIYLLIFNIVFYETRMRARIKISTNNIYFI